MIENVQPTTNTIGNVRSVRSLYSGQADTRQYSDAEKSEMFKQRENKQLGQRWDDPAIGQILSQGN